MGALKDVYSYKQSFLKVHNCFKKGLDKISDLNPENLIGSSRFLEIGGFLANR